ncbi:MAG: 50S ribosomal protein L16 [Fimbriimonadaceae bacterium]|nr:50S ribosomal protein L16 [Fimbriimonadaceae bacterium]
MLMPKRMKYRKQHRGRMRGLATRGNEISFGQYALVAMEPAWITSRQIEAARIAMTRHIRRGGKVWIRIFPDKPFTKKPLEQRMGKGKAGVEGYVCVVKPGRVMFEMAGPTADVAKEAMRLAMHKMPIRCKFVSLDHAVDDRDWSKAKVAEESITPTEGEATPEATEE